MDMTRFRYRNEPYDTTEYTTDHETGKVSQRSIMKERWVVQRKDAWWRRWEHVCSMPTALDARLAIASMAVGCEWKEG
jgi:hypothetical protein